MAKKGDRGIWILTAFDPDNGRESRAGFREIKGMDSPWDKDFLGGYEYGITQDEDNTGGARGDQGA